MGRVRTCVPAGDVVVLDNVTRVSVSDGVVLTLSTGVFLQVRARSELARCSATNRLALCAAHTQGGYALP